MTSSGLSRAIGHTARAPACVIITGTDDASMTSRLVRSPQCEMSMAMPSLFMRSTARRPKFVRPASDRSARPDPSMLDCEYAMPSCRTPKPYSTSMRSSSFSIIVAHSNPAMSATFPAAFASRTSCTLVASTT